MTFRDRAVGHVRGFLADLRDHGLPAPVPRQRDFLRAIVSVPPRDVTHLYWIARATLTTSVRDAEVFDPVFDLWFRGGPGPSEVDTGGADDEQPAPDAGAEDLPDRAADEGSGREASTAPLDRRMAFARTTDAERRTLSRLRGALPAAIPTIRSRRRRPGRRGDRLDVRKVHRAAWRSGGEVAPRSHWHRRAGAGRRDQESVNSSLICSSRWRIVSLSQPSPNESPHPRPLSQCAGRGEPDVVMGRQWLRVSTSRSPLSHCGEERGVGE